ncbi:MAG: CvpA family protein, partial [Ruminococcaceae bacterium]|nr:CvpA family protein [Oscillospiraceae bacterium]
MKLDLIVLGITLIFVLGGAYLGAMRSLMKILSFFGSALLSLFLFPLLQKSVAFD